MKKLLLLFITFSICGCATLKPAQLPIVNKNTNTLNTQNLRPEDESKTEFLSLWITSCKYGIQRLGDEWVQPNKVEYLSSIISKKLPNARIVVVNNFVTYFNMQHQLREGNIYRGPIWQLIECDENTDKFTSYTPEENPERLSMIIGTLNGTLDGEPFSERMAIFPKCTEGVKECTGWDAQANSIKEIVVVLSNRVIEQHKKLTKR